MLGALAGRPLDKGICSGERPWRPWPPGLPSQRPDLPPWRNHRPQARRFRSCAEQSMNSPDNRTTAARGQRSWRLSTTAWSRSGPYR